MDGEEDYSGAGARLSEDTAKSQDQNDMTFYINSYLKDAMKVSNVLSLSDLLLKNIPPGAYMHGRISLASLGFPDIPCISSFTWKVLPCPSLHHLLNQPPSDSF